MSQSDISKWRPPVSSLPRYRLAVVARAALTEVNDIVLLMWHYLLTIDKEVAFFWRRRFSGVCALFLANRYIILVVIIYQSPWWNVHFSQRVSLSLYFVLSRIHVMNSGAYSGSGYPFGKVLPLYATDDCHAATRQGARRRYIYRPSSPTCSTSSGQVSNVFGTLEYTRHEVLTSGVQCSRFCVYMHCRCDGNVRSSFSSFHLVTLRTV